MNAKTTLTALVSLLVIVSNADEPKRTYEPPPARMTDAEMKALLIGTWTDYNGETTHTFTADGRWIFDRDEQDRQSLN